MNISTISTIGFLISSAILIVKHLFIGAGRLENELREKLGMDFNRFYSEVEYDFRRRGKKPLSGINGLGLGQIAWRHDILNKMKKTYNIKIESVRWKVFDTIVLLIGFICIALMFLI